MLRKGYWNSFDDETVIKMTQDGLKIIDGLRKGKDILPIYCFYGDSFMIDEAIQYLKTKILSSSFKDMNYHTMDAKDGYAEDIISIAQTFPVMSPKRFIVVSRVETLSKTNQQAFLSYIKDPARHSCLIFISSTGKIDKRLGFFIELDKADYLVHFKTPRDADMPSLIKKEVAMLGKKIKDDAVGFLLEATGAELMDVKQEIIKLVLFVGERDSIEKKDVEFMVTNSRVDTVFNLADSIGKKNLREAMINLRQLALHGEQYVKILGVIARHFRIIWRVKTLKKNGAALGKIASTLAVFPSYVDGYVRQGRAFNDEGLLKIFEMFHNADIALKSSRQSPNMVIERLILELCA